ncbi:MAG: hypothetical protein IJB96_02030 [Lachnospira sp.]|nr:hypothetical protein [Lachnospira sp.]
MPAGVYITKKKNNTEYYRVSFTYKNKHISLGSFDDINKASLVYNEALDIVSNPAIHFVNAETHSTSYNDLMPNITFEKYIILINFRDNNIYIKTPIYLCNKYFLYFLTQENVLTFSTDDLFYYSNHKIMSRGGYYFVNDYGIQSSILTRYGIRAHSVKGRDYIFKNGDEKDYRYENVYVINQYNGVSVIEKKGRTMYRAIIHINGNYIIGDYASEAQAAIAYNKAADMLVNKTAVNYTRNYIDNISSIEYASMYNMVKISKKFREYITTL